MSIILVQVGQCGNQVGTEYFNTIINDCYETTRNVPPALDISYKQQSISRFFHELPSGTLEANSVMIDMEEKVVQNLRNKSSCDSSKTWIYGEKNFYCHKKGSGNNWAQGYMEHGPIVEQHVDELVRYRMEKCDRVDGLLVTMSVAGGTGSGVGTRICRYISSHYASQNVMALAVWPYSRGEVSVQTYNGVLSLSHLLNPSSSACIDGMILFQNDTLHQICAKRLNLNKVGMEHLNTLIAHQLAGLLQPVNDEPGSLSSLLCNLCSHPDYRLLQLRCLPYMQDKCRVFNTTTWSQLIKHLRQMIIADAPMEEGIDWSVEASNRRATYLANQITLRGTDLTSADTSSLSDSLLYTSWLPERERVHVYSTARPFRCYAQSITLASNGQGCINILDQSVAKAWSMFTSHAFLHQYEKHGISRATMLDSFATVEQIISNYRNLSGS